MEAVIIPLLDRSEKPEITAFGAWVTCARKSLR